MKKSKLTIMALAAGLGLMASASQVQALPYQAPQLIDNFDFTGSSKAEDPIEYTGLVPTIPQSSTVAPPGVGGYVLPGWSRTDIYAFAVPNATSPYGDKLNIEDCAICDRGHFNNDSATYGHVYWGWFDDLTVDGNGDGDFADPILGIKDFEFDYGADVAGADVFVSFDVNGTKVAQYQWSDLAATGADINGQLNLASLHADIPGISLLGITSIRLDVFSNGGAYTDETGWLGNLQLGDRATNLDFDVDNVGVTPEPATMALMGLGLAAFGWSRRKSA